MITQNSPVIAHPRVYNILFVEHDAVVMLATSVTATTRVLAVLANTTVSGRHVSALLAVLLQVGRLYTISRTKYKRFA